MTLYSYIVMHDRGFSPNPFHGVCTLACCKPMIRRTAVRGDWVAGLSPKRHGNHLVYAMRVNEVLPFGEYWESARFHEKRPNFATFEGSLGDNIYEPMAPEKFKQHRSWHSLVDGRLPAGDYQRFVDRERINTKDRDLSGKHVLVAREFVYYGIDNAIILPEEWRQTLAVGRGHRKITDSDIIKRWEEFMAGRLTGLTCCPPVPSTATLCGCNEGANAEACQSRSPE